MKCPICSAELELSLVQCEINETVVESVVETVEQPVVETVEQPVVESDLVSCTECDFKAVNNDVFDRLHGSIHPRKGN